MRQIVLLLFILLVGCSTEIEVLTGDFASTPVIYGIIDPFDTLQSIRVQRSFLIRDKTGAQLQDPDSIYFKTVRVWLEGMVGDSCVWSIELDRNYVKKEEGEFTGVNHHVFSNSGKLPITLYGETEQNPGVPDISQIYLRVSITDLNIEVSARETVYSPCKVMNNGRLSKTIKVYGDNPTSFSLLTASKFNSDGHEPAEIRFNVFISEYTKDQHIHDTLTWHTSNGFDKGGYTLTPEGLFNRIMLSLSESDSVEVRVIDSIEVEMAFAATSFTEGTKNQQIYGVVDYPLSKIEGCYGVFTTKSKGRLSNMQLDAESMDSLCNGQRWKHLKFRHW